MNKGQSFLSTFNRAVLKAIFIVLLMLINRTLAAQINTAYFKVTYATSQSWSGGAAGSGSGIYYNFHIVCKKTANIKFDSVWIDFSYNHLFSRSAMMIEKSDFKKGDSIFLSAEIHYPGEMYPGFGQKEPTKIPSPCKECKSSPVIIFRVNGKKYYYAVTKITGLEPINYP